MNERSKTIVFILVAVIAVAFLSFYAARRPVDYPVYRATARTMLAGSGPLYGPTSGTGWPQVYRYPPLFLILFIPFALLSLKTGAALFAALKFVALFYLERELFLRLDLKPKWLRFLAFLPALPYLALEFHYGNAEFLIFALTAACLLWIEERPVAASLALALGISIKVWPLFFLPYLAAKRRGREVAMTLAFTVLLTVLPAGYFGWHRNTELLGQWANQEFGVAADAGEPGIVGFPSQSLHSVMMRYLVSLDYSRLPDPNYPRYNFATMNARVVESTWMLLAALGYAGLLLLAYQSGESETLTVDAIALCSLLILEPFTQSGDLVLLLWPIAVAVAALRKDHALPDWARGALYAALFFMVAKPLLPTAALHRSLQVLGADFWETSLLCLGLLGKYWADARAARRLEREAPVAA